MKKNLPVTDREKSFVGQDKLITVTDKQGNITECNDAFVAMSGFTREELLGQPHNIVRHPDMPAAAFGVMWEHLKSGKPWMGVIKNRCKNGDFYWVDAYVTPMTRNGEITGYESVRSAPKRPDVLRTQRLYTKLQNQTSNQASNQTASQSSNKARGFLPYFAPYQLFLVLALLAWLGLWQSGHNILAQIGLALSVLIYAVWVSRVRHSAINSLNGLLRNSFSHELAVQSYTDDRGGVGKLKVAILSELSHLGTVISRIENAASNVAQETDTGLSLTQNTRSEIECQQSETAQVATAMNQMSTTIHEVSRHVSDTAVAADTANTLVNQGSAIAEVTKQSIETLRNTVTDIGVSVSAVSEQTGCIAKAAQMIEQIADQTNLLALNAAIEAARAGEQGRGFAVVADEVRNLAKRTQASTQEIYSIIKELTQRADDAVSVAYQGAANADAGVARVVESSAMLDGIADSVSQIANMSTQMAAAVEQQASVAEEINRQVVNISGLADSSADSATQASSSLLHLKTISVDLHELVVRFKHS
ncbi:PAS domain-containing methyl-accepting chemotaxis protein [Oceanisphaera sp. IT1-181]|uniref:methyl-accepting chemotaxis protein n=1 Tax=Oceanisphaera sp. IT1-181 TaxID=3081199 RepID=UPI0029CA04EB|nr:PAS domain-containing methyl-accepting chemotaxis protein [Oceanisphaera sp. IT1-181]